MSSHNSESGDDHQPGFRPQYVLLPQKDPCITLSVPIENLIRIESIADNICGIHYFHPSSGDKKCEVHAYTIGQFEDDLCRHPLFFRVHNQHIINYSQVLRNDTKAFMIEMKTREFIPLSRRHKKAYLEHIGCFCILVNTR